MNNKTPTYREKGRALFLAAIMVLSVVAVSATAFSGAVAAQNGDVEIDDVTVNPDTANDDATYTTDFNITSESRDNIDYVSVDLSDASADNLDLSQVDTNDVAVSEPDGTAIDVAGVTATDNSGNGVDDTLIVELDSTTSFQQADGFTVQVDDVNNPGPGTYNLALGLHEDDGGSPGPAVTADTDSFSIDSGALPSGPTDNTQDLRVAPGQSVQVANVSYETPGEVDQINVSVVDGNQATAGVDDVDRLVVRLFNSSGDFIEASEVSYDSSVVTTGFSGATDVENIQIFAVLADNPTNQNELDAVYTKSVNPSVTIDTQNTQLIETDPANLTLIRGNVEDRNTEEGVNGLNAEMYNPNEVDSEGNPLPGAVPIANDTTRTINSRTGEFRIEFAMQQPTEEYTFTIEDSADEYRIFPNTEEIRQGEDNNVVVRIEERNFPDDIEKEQSDFVATANYEDGEGDTIKITTTVFGEDGDPYEGAEVNLTHDGEDGSFYFEEPAAGNADSAVNTTDASGQAVFVVGSDTPQSVEFTFTVVDPVDPERDQENNPVQTTANKDFVLQGDGYIEGYVQASDMPAPENSLEGAQVWAIPRETFTSQSETVPTPNAVGDTWWYRLVNNETGEIMSVDNDYRIDNDGQNNNLQISRVDALNTTNAAVGSGWVVRSTVSNPGDMFVTPLEAGEYRLERSPTAPNASDDRFTDSSNPSESFTIVKNFSTVEDLDYESAQNRSAASGQQLNDTTDQDGQYILQDMFTNFQAGVEYTVIATAPQYDTRYGDALVNEDGAFFEERPDNDYVLFPVDIDPDYVDIQQVGLHPPLSETGGLPDPNEITDFNDQSDDFYQEVPRDGSVDVFTVEAGYEDAAGDIQPLDTPVQVDFDDPVDGQFIGVLGGDNVTNYGSESITVNPGADGEATLLFETNSASGTVRTQKQATLTENTAVTDESNVTFVGVTRVERAGVSGIVRDSNDVPIPDSVVWTEEIDLWPSNERGPAIGDLRVEITPNTSEAPGTAAYAEAVNDPDDEFVVQLYGYNATSGFFDIDRGSETVERQDLRSYDFPDTVFPELDAVGEYNLVDVAADDPASYTLEPIPAVNDSGGNFGEYDTAYTLRGVKLETPEQGVRSLDALFDVLPGEGETQNVIIPIELENFEPSVSDYANNNGVVDTPGLREAIDDWRNDEIDTSLLRDVIDAWRSGEVVT